jgi:hypothetical protein
MDIERPKSVSSSRAAGFFIGEQPIPLPHSRFFHPTWGHYEHSIAGTGLRNACALPISNGDLAMTQNNPLKLGTRNILSARRMGLMASVAGLQAKMRA